MDIRELRVYGYKRIRNSLEKELHIELDTSVCVIVGTNGSGKSSLLELLTPFLIKSNTLEKGGYVEMAITKNNVDYSLTIIQETSTHSFVREGKELNGNGLYTTYCELVEEHFLSRKLYNFIVGTTYSNTLLGMSISARRDLLTSISKTDFVLLNSVLQEVKSKLKYNTNVLTHENNKLKGNDGEGISKDDIKNLNKDVQLLERKIDKLTRERVAITAEPVSLADLTNLRKQTEAIEAKLVKFKKTKEELRKVITIEIDNIDVQSVQLTLSGVSADKTNALYRMSLLEQEISDIKELLGTVDDSNLHKTKEELETNIHELAKEINKLDKAYTLSVEPSVDRYYRFTSMEDELIRLISQVPANNQLFEDDFPIVYSYAYYEEIKTTCDQLQRTINELDSTLSSDVLRAQHIRTVLDSSQTECPKCHTEFANCEYTEDEHNALTKHILQLTTKIASLKEDHEKAVIIDEYLSLAHTCITGLERLREGFMELYRALEEAGVMTGNMSEALHIINQHKDQYHTGNLLVEKQKQLDSYRKHLVEVTETLESSTLVNKDQLLMKLQVAKKEYSVHQTMLSVATKDINNMERLKTVLVNITKNSEELDRVTHQLLRDSELLKRIDKNNAIDRDLHAYNTEISRKRIEVNNLTSTLASIESINNLVAEYSHKVDTFKELSALLNPNKGFIAYVLRNSINSIITRVNNYLERIWSTDVTLEYIRDTDTVDYKFWANIDGNISPVSNVNKASGDIISFLCKLVIADIAGLDEYPVYLDELGSSFDELHRQRVFEFIRDDLITNHRGTIFLVSHYDTSYGILDSSNVTYIILDDKNINTADIKGKIVRL